MKIKFNLIRVTGAVSLALALGACSNMSPQARDTAVGATAGAVLGGVLTGNTTGAAVGAAAGGVIGSQVNNNQYDERRPHRRY